ncbi:SRPBCC domain-containing protein [Alkalihalobacillus oceani]|uniref:CoxG family protein n=1 Tax=Halalkalibacter oceani TaxID=1653776 RepID=UPI00203DFF42|nr:SRPBCC domain-containing protein [Halalkalibacter oceani]MCM3760277.1 SRPBCC domain-containing protein [Halalkalibacter oceani]
MIIEDQFNVQAKKQDVWTFLMDTEQLARCLPGCEEVDEVEDGVYQAVAKVQIAFMKLKFNLNVRITDLDPPNQLQSEIVGKPFSLVGQLKVQAKLDLVEVEEGSTDVQYFMDLSLAGKLGSIGQSAFRSKATEMGAEFAANIREALEENTVKR